METWMIVVSVIGWYLVGLVASAIGIWMDRYWYGRDTTARDLLVYLFISLMGPLVLYFAVEELVKGSGIFDVVLFKKKEK